MKTPRVPRANKSFVNTSARSMGRTSMKAARSGSRSGRTHSSDTAGLGMLGAFALGLVIDILLQTGVIS